MKHVLSISLGSSSRDKTAEAELLGERFIIERRGTDGSLATFERLMTENDGRVDCLCVGGANLGLHCAGKFYRFREIARATRNVRQTPLVDGAGVKNSLERRTVHWLQERGVVDFRTSTVLVACGMDRFGMAETLDELGANCIFGDLMFNVAVPVVIPSLQALQGIGGILLPLVVQLPFQWLYPTGERQDEIIPRFHHAWEWADIIVGDFLIIRRYMPDDLSGKVIVTNTTTEQDVAELRRRGVRLLVTSTPVLDGRAFATNVLEGIFVCLLGRPPAELGPEDYLGLADRLGWEPTVRDLTEPAEEGTL